MFSISDRAPRRARRKMTRSPLRFLLLAPPLALAAVALAALMALSSFVAPAEARGGRTTAADCAAGSDDPDCPDTSETQNKPPPQSGAPPQPRNK
jgi:hypothetical protein